MLYLSLFLSFFFKVCRAPAAKPGHQQQPQSQQQQQQSQQQQQQQQSQQLLPSVSQICGLMEVLLPEKSHSPIHDSRARSSRVTCRRPPSVSIPFPRRKHGEASVRTWIHSRLRQLRFCVSNSCFEVTAWIIKANLFRITGVTTARCVSSAVRPHVLFASTFVMEEIRSTAAVDLVMSITTILSSLRIFELGVMQLRSQRRLIRWPGKSQRLKMLSMKRYTTQNSGMRRKVTVRSRFLQWCPSTHKSGQRFGMS